MEARPWPQGTRVYILHVLDAAVKMWAWVTVEPFADTMTEAAEALVQSAAERLRSRGLNASTAVTQGNPPTVIIDHARQMGADFVMLGSHGHSGITRFLLGSVAKDIVRGAPCSAEIVRQPTADTVRRGAGLKILLATDGSESSESAVRSVAERPWPPNSEVKVLSVAFFVLPPIEPGYIDPRFIERLQDEAASLAKESVSSAENIIRDAGLHVTTAVLEGDPRLMILDEAQQWGADIIVIGSHGQSGIERLVLGSVSEAVALHAHSSVEVIRQRAIASEGED